MEKRSELLLQVTQQDSSLEITMFKKALNAAKDVSSSALEQSKRAVDQTKQKLAELDESNTCKSCGKVLSTTLAL